MKKVRITYSGTAQLRELIWCWSLRFVPLPSPVCDCIMDFEHFKCVDEEHKKSGTLTDNPFYLFILTTSF